MQEQKERAMQAENQEDAHTQKIIDILKCIKS